MNIERHIVLVHPQIHWNTGNIGRTCLATGAELHLIKPLGFSLESRHVKRAGLDYWPRVRLQLWDNFRHFEKKLGPRNGEIVLLTKLGEKPFWAMPAARRLFLVFGSETGGLPPSILSKYASCTYHIPITGDTRSLNLSTAAGIVLYESLRHSGMTHFWKSSGRSITDEDHEDMA
jgi:tRNA (cytidine/uridine-2'-O-)-methyltransferase